MSDQTREESEESTRGSATSERQGHQVQAPFQKRFVVSGLKALAHRIAVAAVKDGEPGGVESRENSSRDGNSAGERMRCRSLKAVGMAGLVAKFYAKFEDRLLYGTGIRFDKPMYPSIFRILEILDEHFYETDMFS